MRTFLPITLAGRRCPLALLRPGRGQIVAEVCQRRSTARRLKMCRPPWTANLADRPDRLRRGAGDERRRARLTIPVKYFDQPALL